MEVFKKENNDEIEIKLKGRLDTNTYNDLESKLEGIDNNKKIIFNFEELEYISSIGLRTILKTKKKNDETRITNCNSDVYEVFSMTGFTEIIDITKSVRKISVDGCEIINKGTNNTLYRLDNEKIVKVYNRGYSIDTIKQEIECTRRALIMGIPTVIPYELVKVGDLNGAVYELIDSKSLQQLIKDGGNTNEIVKNMVNLLKKVHSTEDSEGELPGKKKQIIEIGSKCKDCLPKEIGEKLMSLIYDLPMTNTVIHGNFHIKNIMKNNDEMVLIDMDTIATGHPIIDLGIIHAIYKGSSCVNTSELHSFLDITKKQSEQIIELLFKYYFEDKTPEEIEEIMKKASVVGYMYILWRRITNSKKDENEEKEIEFCKRYLTDNITKIDSLKF